MHLRILAVAAASLLIGSGSAVWAQSATVEKTPGHMMQNSPTSKAPGASEYAPGDLKRTGRKGGPGASKYTPSHRANVGLSTDRRTSTRARMGTRTRTNER
jgi:hypothetical protein